jgi:hypothetical protein
VLLGLVQSAPCADESLCGVHYATGRGFQRVREHCKTLYL